MTARGCIWLTSLLTLPGWACAPGGGTPTTTRATASTAPATASAATGSTATTTTAVRRGPTTRPSEAPVITITGVEGMVQVRESSNKPWQKAVVGMNVTEGAEFRTGPRSAVRVLIPPDETITLDRPGVIKLKQAIQQGSTMKTMPYGRTRYDVEELGVEHQSELVSPSSTLSIRGQKVSIKGR